MKTAILFFAVLCAVALSQTVFDAVTTRSDLSNLTTAVEEYTNVTDALGNTASNLTLFAPVDPNALNTSTPAATLEYHVTSDYLGSGALPGADSAAAVNRSFDGEQASFFLFSNVGGTAYVNGAEITIPDANVTENGVVHVISEVLDMMKVVDGSVVDAALALPQLSTLAEAVVNASLAGVLGNTDDFYTVFAPNNAAFEAIEGAVANLTDAELAEVLKLHVVSGVNVADSIVDPLTSLEGSELTFTTTTVTGGSVTANIIATDYIARNAVVHVIDAVLLPEAGASPSPSPSPGSSPSPTGNNTGNNTTPSPSPEGPAGGAAAAIVPFMAALAVVVAVVF